MRIQLFVAIIAALAIISVADAKKAPKKSEAWGQVVKITSPKPDDVFTAGSTITVSWEVEKDAEISGLTIKIYDATNMGIDILSSDHGEHLHKKGESGSVKYTIPKDTVPGAWKVSAVSRGIELPEATVYFHVEAERNDDLSHELKKLSKTQVKNLRTWGKSIDIVKPEKDSMFRPGDNIEIQWTAAQDEISVPDFNIKVFDPTNMNIFRVYSSANFVTRKDSVITVQFRVPEDAIPGQWKVAATTRGLELPYCAVIFHVVQLQSVQAESWQGAIAFKNPTENAVVKPGDKIFVEWSATREVVIPHFSVEVVNQLNTQSWKIYVNDLFKTQAGLTESVIFQLPEDAIPGTYTLRASYRGLNVPGASTKFVVQDSSDN